VLSEIPHLWRKAVNRWTRLNRRHHRDVDGQPAPSRNDEYLFYQSLVGVWPLSPLDEKTRGELTARMTAYMEKATREAKVHTSWINPNIEYDAAVHEFVTAVLGNHRKNRFLSEFARFHDQIVNWGLNSALSQTLLKLTSPGVPDIYQGQELWDFSLVDPDNRRPVDFKSCHKMLTRLRKDVGRNDRSLLAVARRLSQNPLDPRIKLFVTWRVLQFRRQHPEIFQFGDYIPLTVEGAKARHLCAFARQWHPSPETGPTATIVVIAPRLLAQMMTTPKSPLPPRPQSFSDLWGDTQILLDHLPSSLKDVFTGQICNLEKSRISVAAALADFPIAMLSSIPQ
jgi:(1->4)-alpha-D-glucan 1-alpha-D-glucosylmutase